MKSEPETFSIADLQRDGESLWDGVRNFRARNFMKNEMAVGDLVLFYHSNAKPPGVAGLARVSSETLPDPTQFKAKSQYFDERSTKDNPRWWLVKVAFVEAFERFVPLPELREDPALEGMPLLEKGMRLSVQPVEKQHFQHILRLAKAKTKLR